MTASASRTLLGGHSPAAFLTRFWQKNACLVRGAIPGFQGIFTRGELFDLASRDEFESRLVMRERGRWSLAHGPFPARELRRLPPSRWTLLVQGANLANAEADALLRRFAFLPFARLDDLMVSYAAPGGGVGPHVDSYDVFLLQGPGRRRWRYGKQRDLSLVPDLPLKILARFEPRHDAVLDASDMLYLPPQFAHDGVAIDACTTYSIGFRAASNTEIGEAFFDYLRDEVALPGRYTDAGIVPARRPGRIDNAMRREVAKTLAQLRWNRHDVARFLGIFLSEPKASVQFTQPSPLLAGVPFARRIARSGITLDRATQFLYDDDAFYMNGEATPMPPAGREMLMRLADRRHLDARECGSLPAPARALLHQWYRHGYARIDA